MVLRRNGKYSLFSQSTKHGHVQQMCNNKKSNYLYYFTPISSINLEPSVQVVRACEQALGCMFMMG